jgi:hypothetical protein
VAKSIQEFGWRQPIVVDKECVIVVGHVRLKAAYQLGLDRAPVHVAIDLTPAQIRAYRLMDNRSNDYASFDIDLLGEPCWYVRKKNAPWFGRPGATNTTIWDTASLKQIMGGSDETKYDHPTQKPCELMRRPILNHLKRGDLVFDPFLGSGTTLMAAETAERVCNGIELEPRYVDVIVTRWEQFTGQKATLEATGQTFEEVRDVRQGKAKTRKTA